jgi:hypothetical protein
LAKNNPARLERDRTPALVSIRYNPLMIAFYQRLKEKGKNGKVIVCAIMRKLVHVIFGVLKSSKMYDPNYKRIEDYQLIFPRKSGHPPKLHALSVRTRRESNNSMPSAF